MRERSNRKRRRGGSHLNAAGDGNKLVIVALPIPSLLLPDEVRIVARGNLINSRYLPKSIVLMIYI